MGTPEFAVHSLNALLVAGFDIAAVVTVPDRQSGRGLKPTPSAVKEYALQHRLPLLQPDKLRDPAFISSLQRIDADLFVVVAFRMLPQVVWSMPRLGTFNLHASLLPQYRGAAPINWAIIDGEKDTGVTTFLLNERIDEGMLLMQESTPIAPDDNAGTLHDRLAVMGADLVVRTADALFSGTITPRQQARELNLRPAPKIFKPDCAIRWERHGQEIHDLVRGLSPYPAATASFTDHAGKTIGMKIFNTEFIPSDDDHQLGTIFSDQKKRFEIAVKGGIIRILSLQVNGKKKISVDEFLRGYNVSDWKLQI